MTNPDKTTPFTGSTVLHSEAHGAAHTVSYGVWLSVLPLSALMCALLTFGCGDDAEEGAQVRQGDDAGQDVGTAPEGAPKWYGEVDQIVDQHCGACHVGGGSAPFELDTPESWQSFGMAAMNAIDTGRMPPWMPDPDCRDFEHERLMPSADIERMREWMDAERPSGDPGNASAPIERLTFDATLRLTLAEPYLPSIEGADDYRCFILDHTVTETTFLTGSFVEPGNGLVHHVLAYSLSGDDADAAREAATATPGPGYTCFGSPVPASDSTGGSLGDRLTENARPPQQIGAWVPGQTPNIAPDGMAMKLDPGVLIVIQVHYSAVGGQAMQDAGTTLLLLTTDETPEFLRTTRPIPVRQLDIPAGEANAVNQMTLPFFGSTPTVIRGLTGHMHLLGRTLQTEVVRGNGDRECALSIPDWDFAWQGSYLLAEENWIVVESGDAIELTCVHDNSAENQPMVDGVQVEPRDVAWGEGTLDEMCLVYLDTVTPYVQEEDGALCPVICADECADQGAECLMACAGADLECAGCLVDAVRECGGAVCSFELVDSRECLTTCATTSIAVNGSFHECLTDTCGEDYGAYLTCLDDVITSPACTLELARCLR
jgi:hypothetical protein